MMASEKTSSRELIQSSMDFLREKWRSAAWSVVVIFVLVLVCLVIGKGLIALGLIAGWVMSFANYVLLAFMLDSVINRYRRKGSRALALVLTVAGYHLRFWVLILAIYYSFQLYGSGFGLAMIIGMSLLKWVTVCEALDRAFSDEF